MHRATDSTDACLLDRRDTHEDRGRAKQFFITPRENRLKWLENNFSAQKKALIMLHYGWASPDAVAKLSDEVVEFLVDALIWSKRIEVTTRE